MLLALSICLQASAAGLRLPLELPVPGRCLQSEGHGQVRLNTALSPPKLGVRAPPFVPTMRRLLKSVDDAQRFGVSW